MSHADQHHASFACACRDVGVAVVTGASYVPRFLRTLHGWGKRRRQMQALLELDDRLLLDVGIRREDADRGAAQLYWRAYSRRHLK